LKIILLHQHVPEDAGGDELDLLDELQTVGEALAELGHQSADVTFSLDLQRVAARLSRARPDLIFNLVESVEGSGRLLYLAPALLDFLRLPYSGCSTEALFTTSNKVLAKTLLRNAGIPTADWLSTREVLGENDGEGGPWIVKSTWEHASVGMDEGAFTRDAAALRRRFEALGASKFDYFAEDYVSGREFNVGVLGGPEGPEVLPCAEMRFLDYPEDKPKLLDYRAKWVEGSFEYEHTKRSFNFAPEDEPLREELRRLALQCWRLFRLRGYARVDFRVDQQGHPWVLEVNANPCISAEAGFIKAAEQAGLSPAQVISRILSDSVGGDSACVFENS
jgi:D-alanine-D-alanine ligase